MADKDVLNVLVVDDEVVVRELFRRFLKLLPVRAAIASGGQEAIELAKKERFDLVFLDIRMPVMNGLEVFSEIRKIIPGVPCVFMTGYGSAEEELLAKVKDSSIQCLRKPFEDLAILKDLIAKAFLSSGRQEGQKDRRSSVRLDLALEVEYKPSGRDRPFKKTVSKNISLGGIRLVIGEEPAAGTMLDMVIRNIERNKSCLVKAEVVWVKASQEKPGFFDCGLKFVEMNINELAKLISRQ